MPEDGRSRCSTARLSLCRGGRDRFFHRFLVCAHNKSLSLLRQKLFSPWDILLISPNRECANVPNDFKYATYFFGNFRTEKPRRKPRTQAYSVDALGPKSQVRRPAASAR